MERNYPQADFTNTVQGHEVWYYRFPDGWTATILTRTDRMILRDLHGNSSPEAASIAAKEWLDVYL